MCGGALLFNSRDTTRVWGHRYPMLEMCGDTNVNGRDAMYVCMYVGGGALMSDDRDATCVFVCVGGGIYV